MTELKIIPGTNDRYAADEDGNIWSLYHSRGKRTEPKLLKTRHSRYGYFLVNIFVEHKRSVTMSVHRLVYSAFHGPLSSDMEINHINGKRDDNRLANLETVSASENVLHGRYVLGRCLGEDSGRSKLTDQQVQSIRDEYITESASYRQLSKKYGVTFSHIGNIIRNEQRTRKTGQSIMSEDEWRKRHKA